MLLDNGVREGIRTALFHARKKVVAAEQPERAVPLHRAKPARLVGDVDDREGQAT